jgi:muramoyltetrapeptide carboxypeptidase LdcA involved in peptidoglycan recycling
MIRPAKLKKGDTVAAITLSWGGAGECPERYAQGKKQIEKTFGLKVIETPNALKSEDWIYTHPEKRLSDMIWAFQNKDVKAIFTTIGGDDSIRLLKHITPKHLEIIKDNPKIFIGHSDNTIANFLCLKTGLQPYYGPPIMFGFAENGGIDSYTKEYFEKAVFLNRPIGEIKSCDEWILDKVPWTSEGNRIIRKRQHGQKIRFIQGEGKISGRLIGGCMDVLEILKGTVLWPDINAWSGAVLFLETSEDIPSVDTFTYWLRNYGAQGILSKLNGILLGIPGGDIDFDDPEYSKKLELHLKLFDELDDAIKKVTKEYDCENLCIVTRINFGHTVPMITIPYGATIEIDADKKKLTILD